MNFFEKHVAFVDCIAFDALYVGYRSYANGSLFRRNTKIGRYCSIGRRCTINAGRHPAHWLSTHPFVFDRSYSPIAVDWAERDGDVVVGNDVWVGDNAVVLSGVTIGDGAVIGAGCIVTKDVPPYAICVGAPAKVQRFRFDEATIGALSAIRWWDYEENILQDLPFDDVSKCIEILRQRVTSGNYHLLPPHFERVRKASR